MKQFRYILLGLLVCVAGMTFAQNVTQVEAHQEGKMAIVTYYLDQIADITLQVSIDGGQTFSPPLTKVTGDAGSSVRPGFKRIVWDILAERESLSGDNIVFLVTAYPKVVATTAPATPTTTTRPTTQPTYTPTQHSAPTPQVTYTPNPTPAPAPQTTYTPPTPQQNYPPVNQPPMGQVANVSGGHEYVNLGLPSGTRWATCNLGANRPEEYGHYYAWGEVNLSSSYDWSTYKYCQGSYATLLKYCTMPSFGSVDNKKQLEFSDDAARYSWGGNWRIPTKQEQDELREKCKWEWTNMNGVNGYRVTGPSGKFIFLPAAGLYDGIGVSLAGSHGYYWSSSLLETLPRYAYFILFDGKRVGWFNSNRALGHTIRPVCD